MNCYSTGTVRGQYDVGGLIGRIGRSGWGDATASFFDVEKTGPEMVDAELGRTTAVTFLAAGWDFVGEVENGTEEIWWIDEGRDYPRLWWEGAGAEF